MWSTLTWSVTFTNSFFHLSHMTSLCKFIFQVKTLMYRIIKCRGGGETCLFCTTPKCGHTEIRIPSLSVYCTSLINIQSIYVYGGTIGSICVHGEHRCVCIVQGNFYLHVDSLKSEIPICMLEKCLSIEVAERA